MAEYAIPHWIQPPDIAAQYYHGLELGQQAASEQQRLQFQQMQSERDHMLEMQRMQITKAYQDQQIQLRQQEVKQQQQKIDIDTKDAARRMEAYQKFQAAVQAGEDTVGAALKYLPGGGEALGGIGTLASAFEREKRSRTAPQEPYPVDIGGHKGIAIPGEYGQRPQYHFFSEDPLSRSLITGEISDMQRQRDKIDAQIAKMEENVMGLTEPPTGSENAYAKGQRKQYEALKARAAQMDQDISDMRTRARGGTPAPEPERTAPPGPGLQVPTETGPGQAPAFNGRVVAIRPKTPSSAPAAYAQPGAPARLGTVGQYGPQMIPIPQGMAPQAPQAPQAPPTIAPSEPGPAFMPSSRTVQPPAIPFVPTTAPTPLFDQNLTPGSNEYGMAVSQAQEGFMKSLQNYAPTDLVAAMKRLGVKDASYDPGSSTFYAPSFMQSGDRDAFESQLLKLATDKNLNPLQ